MRKRDDLLEGRGCNFKVKNKLKSGIFNDKKIDKQKIFPLSQLNSNCEILTKNLVIFIKR